MQARHEAYDALEASPLWQIEIPADIIEALKYPLREYQERALKRFIYFYEQEPNKITNHALFEMATGAGKTLLMAGLMLYLYKKGYRNFIFFVNATTILKKTEANFSDSSNSKYLFADNITLDSAHIEINPIENLDEANPDSLNIMFTTIQGLHTTLDKPRENAVTFDDLQNHKLVLLGDEAHHLQTQSKQQELQLEKSWENTVERIFKGNADNVLLELTATASLDKPNIAEKYHDKLLYKYALAEFCNAGYSKIISVLINRRDNRDRMLLALLVNQFRKEIASLHNITLKPVILFKSAKIEESKTNQQQFITMLDELEADDITQALQNIGDGNNRASALIDRMLSFWQAKQPNQIATILKREFTARCIINVNDDKEKEAMQIQLNSLEDRKNPIRVIFAVNKLNEGWDVLNLFDIVKLFETKAKTKPTQEAQLIGRGARYYPFSTNPHDENYFIRKYAKDSEHDLRFLETLHYHTKDDSEFITALNKQLEADGLITETGLKEISLDLKDEFKQSDIYSKGYIFVNNRLHRRDTLQKYLRDGKITQDMFADMYIPQPAPEKLNTQVNIFTKIEERDITENIELTQFNPIATKQIRDIPYSIFYKALSKNEFYRFDKLGILLGIKSMRDIYVRCHDVSITFAYDKKGRNQPTANDKLQGVIAVLDKLQKELMVSEYKGGEFEAQAIKTIFKNKKITISKNITEYDGNSAEHFAQTNFSGTSEEEALVKTIEGFLPTQADIEKAWLIRNERHFTLYNFDNGKGFQPDFVLFLQKQD
ncbi:MAG: DEAD/DEAH box helicase family protein, partial [Alphaproteobacteria bacterium]|nr:DEAD/DEAH box helicase family protein [Alphaproteobacteria bacterium]